MAVSGKVSIGNKLYDVTTLEEYTKNPDLFLNGHVAINDESGYVLPVLNSNSPSNAVGIIVGPVFSKINLPSGEECDKYNSDRVIDFNKAESYKQLVAMQNAVMDMEKEIITNPDNTSHYPIKEDDSPAMRLLKEAVNSKHINLDNYEHRFGSNYNNDKRTFNKSNVSLGMLERMATALDMKLTLTLRDVSEEIANPIGHPISIDITGGE